jgi:DHA2 family multidrug resistance protein
MLASSALMAPYLESLAGYPVATAGMAMAPRGIGTMIGMQLASRISQYVDQRKVMAAGLISLGSALYTMSLWTPDVPTAVMSGTFMMQGFSIGLVFNPMTVMAFTTLPPHLRGYATSLQALCRNIGQAVGVSVTSFTLTRGVQTAHADIAGGVTPFDRVLQGNTATSHILDPATRHGAAVLDQMVNHQAQIIAFNSDFRMMTLVVVPPLLLLLVMRRHARAAPKPATGDD